MDFTVWRAVFFGCLALVLSVLVSLNPKCGTIRGRVIGSTGFVLVAAFFFLRAYSHAMYADGMYYSAYRHAALTLLHFGVVVATIGGTCLLWWIGMSLPPDPATARTRRLIGRWLVSAMVSFCLVQVCMVPAYPPLALRITALIIAAVCAVSLIVALILVVAAWRGRTRQVSPDGSPET